MSNRSNQPLATRDDRRFWTLSNGRRIWAHRQFHGAGGFARSFNFMQLFLKGRMVVLPKGVRLFESMLPPPTTSWTVVMIWNHPTRSHNHKLGSTKQWAEVYYHNSGISEMFLGEMWHQQSLKLLPQIKNCQNLLMGQCKWFHVV